MLKGEKTQEEVPIFNETQHPLPTAEQLILAGWPKNRNTLARAILALGIRCGARDIADGAPVTREHLPQREYHHLFPASLLRGAGVPDDEVFRALNCALITWRTNRTLSDKEPLVYLRERAEANTLGEEDLYRRLRSHLIAPSTLAVGGYQSAPESERAERVRHDYSKFLQSRAKLVRSAIEQVCSGKEVDLSACLGDK